MNRIEITYRSNINELNKLNAKLERAEKALAKKQAAAEKYGVLNMTAEEHSEWLATVPTENGWITDKEAIKKNGAWFDLFGAERELTDAKERLAKAETRFEKVQVEFEAHQKEVADLADLQAKEELMKREFEQEQKEWAKDGITLKSRYTGTTPKGRRFWIERNHGWTERSFHCYTLTLTNDQGMAYTVFTSGEFWRAYGIVKNS